MTMLRCYNYTGSYINWLKCPYVQVLQFLYYTLYLISHSLISATANREDTGITIDESFGRMLIRLRKDSENIVESISFHPFWRKNLINYYKALTILHPLKMSYITLLSFMRTSSMTSIINWHYQATFPGIFSRTLAKNEVLPVQKGLYRKKNTSQN